MKVRFAFIGFGNVARAFARMIEARKSDLLGRQGFEWRTTAIATANHGSVLSPAGLDLIEAVNLVERGGSLHTLSEAVAARDPIEVVENCEADIVFETTPLNPVDGEPAITHIRRALDRGINVVTANKGPVAFAYRELSSLAAERGRLFRFEGTVMDGAPVFNLAEYCLPAARVTRLSGVLNSTTNFILTGMETGRSFDDCLNDMRRLGIVEANADYDIDGWDAAIKAVALANVLMQAGAKIADVERVGIRDVSRDRLALASRQGLAIRLVARVEPSSQGVRIRVGPESVPADSPLGCVRGTSNVLLIETDLMGEIAIFETNPGVNQTAYALLSDALRISERLKARASN